MDDDGPAPPPPPPEAALIKARRGDVSIRESARQAGISDATWRVVEHGHRLERDLAGQPYEGQPEVIAKMAATVGVEPDELDATGRPNAIAAADIMRREQDRLDARGPEFPDVVAAATAIEQSKHLTRKQKRQVFAELVTLMGEHHPG